MQTGDSLVFSTSGRTGQADKPRFFDREFTAFPRTKHPEVFFAGMLRYEEELEGISHTRL